VTDIPHSGPTPAGITGRDHRLPCFGEFGLPGCGVAQPFRPADALQVADYCRINSLEMAASPLQAGQVAHVIHILPWFRHIPHCKVARN
jgi:hypothetical protein